MIAAMCCVAPLAAAITGDATHALSPPSIIHLHRMLCFSRYL